MRSDAKKTFFMYNGVMEAEIAVAKIRKYATSDSGDTVEVVERPRGGLSVVLADGQSSGRGAKRVSVSAVRKVITLLSEGVRDGAAARAASDALFTERHGKVSATLNILSVDMQSRTLVITRNNPAPVLIAHGQQVRCLDEPSRPIGFYRDTRPVIHEVSLQAGLTAVAFSDGLLHAGKRTGQAMDVIEEFKNLLLTESPSAQFVADTLLSKALKLDDNRPADDVSVVVLCVVRRSEDEIRRMHLRLPLEP